METHTQERLNIQNEFLGRAVDSDVSWDADAIFSLFVDRPVKNNGDGQHVFATPHGSSIRVYRNTYEVLCAYTRLPLVDGRLIVPADLPV